MSGIDHGTIKGEGEADVQLQEMSWPAVAGGLEGHAGRRADRGRRAARAAPARLHRQHAAGRGGPPRRRAAGRPRDLGAAALAGQLAPSHRLRRHALGRAADVSRRAGRPDRQPGHARLPPGRAPERPRRQHRAGAAGGLRGPPALPRSATTCSCWRRPTGCWAASPNQVDPSIVQNRMGHACEWETSMILHLAPHLVGD